MIFKYMYKEASVVGAAIGMYFLLSVAYDIGYKAKEAELELEQPAEDKEDVIFKNGVAYKRV